MPTGHSQLQYVPYQDGVAKLKPQSVKLEPDNCYVQIKLHSVQALFKSGWLTKPGILTLFSESRLLSSSPTESLQRLHRVETLKRNVPCQIGLGNYLTDLLPARMTDKLHIQLKYVVMQASPIQDLLTHLEQSKDVTRLSLISPHAEVALQVSKIAGQLFSFITRKKKEHEIFSLNVDLSWSNLQPGFYAVIGSSTDEIWPASLSMDTNDRLVDRLTRQPPANCSYAVFKVEVIERRGDEAFRGQLWWQLLQSGKKEILSDLRRFDGELSQERRNQFLEKWYWTVSQVNRLVEQEKSCLLEEQDAIIGTASKEVLEKLTPSTRAESAGFEQLPEMWQRLLNVRSLPELKQSVRDYQLALERSQLVLAQLESQ